MLNRRLHALPTALALAAALLAACTDADTAPATLAERDSASVRIVENPRPPEDAAPLWRLSPEPVVEIGVADGEPAYTLSRVVGALQHPDGVVVVADADSREIRFYGAGGEHLRSVGRRGGGPGEFQNLSGLARYRGDSLAAWDNQASRLSILTGDGRFVREATPRGLATYPKFHGAYADGSWVVTLGFDPAAMMRPDRMGEQRTPFTLLRIGPGGEILDTLGTFRGPEVVVTKTGIMTAHDRIAFGRDFEVAVGTNRLFGGDTDRFEVRAFANDGSPERVVRLAHAPVPVTAAHVDRHAEQQAEAAGAELAGMPPAMRAAMEEAAAAKTEIPHRPTFPAFAELLLDDGGNLWVAEYPPPGAPHVRWRVFDPEGTALGFVDVPSGLLVQDVAGGHLLAVERDDDGVERVRRHRLEPAR